MTKMEVVSVRPIPGSNGRGFEVEVREQLERTERVCEVRSDGLVDVTGDYMAEPERTTPWRRQRIAEINETMRAIDNVGIVRLLDCARAFAKKSEQDRAVNARIKDKGGRDQLTAGDIIEISEELNLFPAEVDHYFF